MRFSSQKEQESYFKSLHYLNSGSQGECYIDKNKKMVYKLLFYYEGLTKEELLRFSYIKNKTFIWPTEEIMVGQRIVGYIMPYRKAKNLYDLNPMSINLNDLEAAITKVYTDIQLITDNNVKAYDIMYNILYSRKKFSIIDTADYSSKKVDFQTNVADFDEEIKCFLVDSYFNYFVSQDKILYNSYEEASSLEFLKEFRKSLSEYAGEDIEILSKVKQLVRYERNAIYLRRINNE